MNFQPPGPPRMGWSIPAQGPFSQKGQSFIPATLLGAELTVTVKTHFPKSVPFVLKRHPQGDALVGAHLEQVGCCSTLTILHHF